MAFYMITENEIPVYALLISLPVFFFTLTLPCPETFTVTSWGTPSAASPFTRPTARAVSSLVKKVSGASLFV